MRMVRKLFVSLVAGMMLVTPFLVRPVGAADINMNALPEIGSGCDIEFRFEVTPPGTASFATELLDVELGAMGDTGPDPDALEPGTYFVKIDGSTTGGDAVDTVVTLVVDGETITIPIVIPVCPDPESIEEENMWESALGEGTWTTVSAGVWGGISGGGDDDDDDGEGDFPECDVDSLEVSIFCEFRVIDCEIEDCPELVDCAVVDCDELFGGGDVDDGDDGGDGDGGNNA